MDNFSSLLKSKCPDGVKYYPLSELGSFYGGLTGKGKDDFKDGNAKFITYMNIFKNPALKIDVQDRVRINEGERQNTIKYGDILFTGSSETPDECGMSSVLTDVTDEKLYLNSFCFGFRFNDLSLVEPRFLKHLFRSSSLRASIAKTANGVTRFNVSKKLFAKIEIPLPPLDIQKEIADALDVFTDLQANLEQELEARKKQYEAYREKLLSFNEIGGGIEWKMISEIGTLTRGSGLQKKDFSEDGVGCIHYGQIYTRLGLYTYTTLSFVPSKLAEKLTPVKSGDLVIACTSENVEDVCKSVVWLGKEDIVTGGHAAVLHHNESPKYIGYCFQSNNFFNQKRMYAYGAKVIDIKTEKLAQIKLPIPPRKRQDEIAEILDSFECTIDNIKKEMSTRQTQYEYYREQLLSF